MSLENEEQSSPDKAHETSRQAQRKLKISYSREFLLSLSELEICKKLPSAFDASIFGECEDAFSHGIQDRQRIPGSLPFQSYRRTDYSSSPPTRGDSITYSRNTYGRWDNRSSGRSDRDSDSQSERDSDSGQRPGNSSRKSWQSSEHDGLLGSGSFPRPSGYASGVSAPKARADDHNNINRTNEPYHPPRPYKAVPHLRRDAKDSLNDETFGSNDSTSQDRAEEERRRRDAFESMRKEQQKALQEKQIMNLEKPKVDSVSEIFALLDDTKEEKRLLRGSDVLDVSATPVVSANDSGKSTILSQTTTSRPLVPPGFVPPGFANTVMEKNSGLKSVMHTQKSGAGKPDSEESLLHVQPKPIHHGALDSLERQSLQDTTFRDHPPEDKIMRAPYMDKGENMMSFPLILQASDSRHGVEDHLRTSSLSETHQYMDDSEVVEISAKVSGSKIQGEFNQNHSTLILEKIFDSALNVGSSTGPTEQIDNKPGDTWTPNSVQSSKFAQWFSEEERKPGDDRSYDRPNDLLSLIVGGDKGKSILSPGNATEHFPSSESLRKRSGLAMQLMSTLSSKERDTEQLYDSSKTDATPRILTCEDLEQTILLEYGSDGCPQPAHSGSIMDQAAFDSVKNSNLQPSLQGWGVAGVKSEQPRVQVDNHASQQLLSLLQKGTSLNQMASSPYVEVDSNKALVSAARDIHEEPREEDVNTSEKKLTLETLFGSAFMNELQSFEAPVSAQRGSVGSSQTNVVEPPGVSFPFKDNGLPSSTNHEAGPYRTSHQNDILPLNYRQNSRPENTANWLGFNDPQMDLNSSKHQIGVISKHAGIKESDEFQLPEDESLFAVSDPLNPQNSMFMPAGTSSRGGSLSAPINIADKFAAIGAFAKEERYPVGAEGSTFVRGPYDRIEPEILHRNLHAQASSPQSHPLQMSHGRPLFYPLDSHPTHMNSQMKFMGPESMIHHDLPSSHQFPTNMIRPHFSRPSAGMTAYDLPAHHPMQPQMQMPGNYPMHPFHEIQRNASFPHLPSQATALMPEVNQMQGFSLGPRQPNTGNLGIPMPAPDMNSGGNQSEAFQRLLEMELRAKSKQQMHPLSRGNSQGMYGHDLDMGFRYR